MTRFADQIRLKVKSQSIKSISRGLQKLLMYFNSKLISAFAIPAILVLFVRLYLNLNDSESVKLSSSGSSLQFCHKLADVFA